jgi:RNA polymerase sigma-70 factor (ECF subfamily)
VTETDLHRLVEDHYDRLFRAARFMAGDLGTAEELVQDTFLAAAEGGKRFEGRSSEYTWLYGILLNKFRRWLRRKRPRTVPLAGNPASSASRADSLASGEPTPLEAAIRKESVRQVREALDGLSADHRAVVTLRYVEGMSYEEIAGVVGCPTGTVKSRIHYALRRIADHLRGTGSVGPPF